MKRSFTPLLSMFSVLAACNVGHMVGQNQQNQGAITCATTTCNGTTVCVDSACVEPSGQCGGIAGLQCAAGQRCVDNPRDNCDWATDADCSGVCVGTPTPQDIDAGNAPADAGTPMSCGGFRPNPPMCPSGYKCVDDPNGCSMAVDCPGICVEDVKNPDVIVQCGGFTPFPVNCGTGEVCVDHPTNCCMANDAPGICIKKIFCGGIASFPCPGTMSCVDDPSDSCDPNNGGADCGGMCVYPRSTAFQCGGIAGIQCPTGLRCLDEPGDGCDPNNGGADCGGLCVP